MWAHLLPGIIDIIWMVLDDFLAPSFLGAAPNGPTIKVHSNVMPHSFIDGDKDFTNKKLYTQTIHFSENKTRGHELQTPSPFRVD